MNRNDVIAKIGKLQAQAESEGTMGNQDAALAFGAAVQRLMLEYEVEQHEVEAASAAKDAPEPVIEKEVDLALLGLGRATKRNGALEDLMRYVGKAHLCTFLLRPGSNWLALVGTPSHCAVAELVVGAMWRAMNQMAVKGLRDAKREGVSVANYTRTFRQAFTWRLAARYQEEQRAIVEETRRPATTVEQLFNECSTIEDAPAESTALTVVNRELERVGSYLKAKGTKTARSRYTRVGSNTRASADGTAAANRVPLRSNAVGSGASRGQLGA
jgi:hypothetical protein